VNPDDTVLFQSTRGRPDRNSPRYVIDMNPPMTVAEGQQRFEQYMATITVPPKDMTRSELTGLCASLGTLLSWAIVRYEGGYVAVPWLIQTDYRPGAGKAGLISNFYLCALSLADMRRKLPRGEWAKRDSLMPQNSGFLAGLPTVYQVTGPWRDAFPR
jgi:hypothetical protein